MSLFFRSPTVTVSLPHTISFTYSNPLCVCVCAHYGHSNCALYSVLLICAHSTRKRMVHSRGWQEKCLIPSLYLHPHWWPQSNSIGHESQKISHKKSMTRWRVVSLFHSTLSSSLTFACNQSPINANQKNELKHVREGIYRFCHPVTFHSKTDPYPSVLSCTTSPPPPFVVGSTVVRTFDSKWAESRISFEWLQFQYSLFLYAVLCGSLAFCNLITTKTKTKREKREAPYYRLS